MLCSHLHFFPVIMALYLPLAFFTTYGMAVHYNHVHPAFPYISDTGALPPESCVFAQLLNIFAALTAWCMYLRYKQVRLYYRQVEMQGMDPGSARHHSVKRKHLVNKVSLGIGMLTALGVSIVGNFQVDNALEVHLTGAMMAFGGTGIYGWIQSIMSYKMAKLPSLRPWCRHARIILSVIHTVCFFVMLIATKISLDKFPSSLSSIKKWKPSQDGYSEHLVATISEWIMAFVSSTFFLTFTGELKVIRTKLSILPIPPTGNSNLISPSRCSRGSARQSLPNDVPLGGY